MRVGRIPYINCYPVYGAIDAGIVRLEAELVTGVPSDLNVKMARGQLDVSVVSAIDRNTLSPDPELVIEKDENGDPTGVFLETEFSAVGPS